MQQLNMQKRLSLVACIEATVCKGRVLRKMGVEGTDTRLRKAPVLRPGDKCVHVQLFDWWYMFSSVIVTSSCGQMRKQLNLLKALCLWRLSDQYYKQTMELHVIVSFY